MVNHRTNSLALLIAVTALLSACAGPIGLAYTATSMTSLASTGKSIPEHAATSITDADCSLLNIFDGEYVCEYSRNPARTYNRNGI